MDKREQIERALGFLQYRGREMVGWRELLNQCNTLVKQAIVIECEVEHDEVGTTFIVEDWTAITVDGHHGTPGKYTFIGLPLEEE